MLSQLGQTAELLTKRRHTSTSTFTYHTDKWQRAGGGGGSHIPDTTRGQPSTVQIKPRAYHVRYRPPTALGGHRGAHPSKEVCRTGG